MVGDFRLRSSMLMYSREIPALKASFSCVSPAALRALRNSSPSMPEGYLLTDGRSVNYSYLLEKWERRQEVTDHAGKGSMRVRPGMGRNLSKLQGESKWKSSARNAARS